MLTMNWQYIQQSLLMLHMEEVYNKSSLIQNQNANDASG